MNKSRIIFTVDIEHDQSVNHYDDHGTGSALSNATYELNLKDILIDKLKLPFHFKIDRVGIDTIVDLDDEEKYKDFDNYVLENAIDELENRLDQDIIGADLHGYLFNEGDGIIYYADAEKWLKEYGVFEAISEVVEYAKDNFGEVYTDIGNSCKVVNMLNYIKGYDLLYENEEIKDILDKYWNDNIPAKKLKKILKLLKEEL
jgi:hypothetical protein